MRSKILGFMAFLLATVLVLTACGKKMTENEYFEQAKLQEQSEEFEAAVDSYLSLYKRFPSGEFGDEALFHAAIIQANILKLFENAIETHDRLLRAFPESKYAHQSLFMKGFIYANDLNNYVKAEEAYVEFLTKYPDSELSTSVEWEMKNLGKDINEIEFLSSDQADSLKAER
jgi:outer membrane protein assembly factor BamD (BamD/ComL family)